MKPEVFCRLQGKTWDLGPTLHFRQDGWSIVCDLVDGRCARINYQKAGDWTQEQFQLVLGANAQGEKWTETSKSGATAIVRSWKRSDSGTAD